MLACLDQWLQRPHSPTTACIAPCRTAPHVSRPCLQLAVVAFVSIAADSVADCTIAMQVRALASLNSLQSKLRSVSTDHVAPADVANESFALWDTFAARAVATRNAWDSANDSSQPGPGGGVVDVELGELHSEPMRAVRRIYSELGYELSPSAEARMTKCASVPTPPCFIRSLRCPSCVALTDTDGSTTVMADGAITRGRREWP